MDGRRLKSLRLLLRELRKSGVLAFSHQVDGETLTLQLAPDSPSPDAPLSIEQVGPGGWKQDGRD